MNYLIRLNIARRESTLEVINADTGELLAARTIHNLPHVTVYSARNRLFEALSCEPGTESVTTETIDWISPKARPAEAWRP